MAVTVTYEEELGSSRKASFSRDTASQVFDFILCGDFLSESSEGPTGLWNDDILAMQAAYDFIPSAISIPSYTPGVNLLLTLASLELEQINWDTWRAHVVYEVPNNGGKIGIGAGQTNTNVMGPAEGENAGAGWSNNFTQVSATGSTTTRNRKFSRAVATCDRSTLIPAGTVPYTVGRPAPIGHTKDGVDGAEVYERQFSFSITSYFAPEKMKYAYVRKLSRMQTTYNSATFFGFAAGSVMFLNYDFSGDLYQVIPVTFEFHVRNNFKFSQSGPTVLADPAVDDPLLMYDTFYEPDFPDTPVISGWAEVDYRYADLPDNTAKMMLQRPILRTIHHNYGAMDFTELEL